MKTPPSQQPDSFVKTLLKRGRSQVSRLLTRTAGHSTSAPSARSLALSDLEQRVVYSATPMPVPVEACDVCEVPGEAVESAESHAQLASERIELVIVDPTVQDYATLIGDLAANSPGEFEVFILDSDRDGIEQVTEILATRSNIDSLHLVSHGTSGNLDLGSGQLNNESIAAYAPLIGQWHDAFSVDADILVYGCNLGTGPGGHELVTSLSILTGADVAASDDRTGNWSQDGDWELEVATGTVETAVPFSKSVQERWDHVLATVTVTQTLDVVNGDTSSTTLLAGDDGGDGTSLREAILAANESASGSDTIQLAAGTYVLTIAGNDDTASLGDLDITEDLFIEGAGAGLTVIDASGLSGADADRVFHVLNSAKVSMTGVTITGGAKGSGAGVNVTAGAELNLVSSIISGNSSGGAKGGGLFSAGTTSLIDVSVLGNSAAGQSGGGIRNEGSMTINRSTISGNSAQNGGGIVSRTLGSQLTLNNVTVSGNTATVNGGGLETNRSVAITSSTLAFNKAASGGGIHHSGTELTLQSTILANNTLSDGTTPDNVSGSVTSIGYNIDSDGSAGLAGPGDQSGTDPLLVALSGNGGSTQTHALQTGSIAIDASARGFSTTTDQRRRLRNGLPDIGAYESNPVSFSETSEFLVNGTLGTGTTDQETSNEDRGSANAVAIAPNGDYVIVWSSNQTTGDDGNGYGVLMRRYSGDGTPITGEIQVNTNTIGDQLHASVAMDDLGRGIVVWTDNDSGEIVGRRFHSNGTVNGGEFPINTTATGSQSNSAVAMDAAGNFVVAWEGNGTGDSTGIFAQRFDDTGSAIGPEFRVNSTTTGTQSEPSVAMNASGEFAVVWDNGAGVFAQSYDASGGTVSTEISVDATASANEADVAMNAAGDIVVVWNKVNGLLGEGVYQRVFSIGGTEILAEEFINTQTFGDQQHPSIAMDSSGASVVIWEQAAFSTTSIHLQRFDSSHGKIGTETTVNVSTDGSRHMASVATLSSDHFVAVWSGAGDQPGEVDSSGVFARQFSTDGIVNAAPTASANGPHTIFEGNSVTLTATTADADGDSLTYEWDLNNDGNFSDLGVSSSNTAAVSWATLQSFGIDDDTGGPYTVGLRVSDGINAPVTATTTITVNNVAPTIFVSDAVGGTTDEGTPYTLNLSATDPGDDTIDQWIVDWGDGTVQEFDDPFTSFTHTYTIGGNYNILVAARDEDGTWAQRKVIVPSWDAGGETVGVYDAGSGSLIDTFDTTDTDPGPSVDLALQRPNAVVVGPNGDIYVSGFQSDNVVKFAADGTFLGEFIASGAGGLNGASGMAFGPDGRLYVSSYHSGDVLRFDATGNFEKVFVSGGGGLNGPTGLAFGPDGKLYVASYGNGKVFHYDPRTGGGETQYINSGLDAPEQIAFDKDGDLWIADDWGQIRKYDGSISTVTIGGNGTGIALTPEGIAYASNYTGNTVVSFDPDVGTSSVSTLIGSVSNPFYLAFMPDHQVVVANKANQPSITAANPDEDEQSSSGLVITPDAADGATVTHYRITGITNGTLFKNDGTSQINNGDFITLDEGLAGLKFTPTGDYHGSTTFNVEASTTGDLTDLSPIATANITVDPVADDPIVPTGLTTPQDTELTGIVIDRNAVDGSEVTHFEITAIMNGVLRKNDNSVINDGDFITYAEAQAGLKFTPTLGFAGTGSFAVQASVSNIGTGLGGNAVTVSINVEANLPPTITAIADQVIDEEGTTGALSFSVGDAETPGSLTVSATSSNGTLIPAGNISLVDLSGGNWTIALTPVSNQFGSSTITVTVDDGTNSVDEVFTVTVTPKADQPSISGTTTDEDTLSATGLVITPNAADGASVTHYRITGITNGTLYQNDGSTEITDGDFILAADGAAGLRFLPALGYFGSGATFTVEASTTGTVADLSPGVSPTITVNPVADNPVVPAGLTTPEDTERTGIVIDRNSQDGGEVTHFQITGITNGVLRKNDNSVINDGNFITYAEAQAGLKFDPAFNFTGTASFDIQASLNATIGGLGGNVVNVPITVTPQNDPPTITAISDQTIDEDTSTGLLPFSVGDTETPGSLSVSAISSNPTLFPVGNLVLNDLGGGNWTINTIAAANEFGTATITVTVSDGTNSVDETFDVTVTPLADTPNITAAVTDEDTQSTSGLVITPNAVDGASVAHYRITGITNGTLYQNDGSTQINNGDFISAADGLAGLRFTPADDYHGSATFNVQASTTGDLTDVSPAAAASITVTPVADDPVVPTGLVTPESTEITNIVIDRAAVDSGEVTHFRVTLISNGTLRRNDNSPITNGQFITYADAQAGLKFMPSLGYNGPASFSVQASTSGSVVGLGGNVVPVSISVLAVNTPPSLSVINITTPLAENTSTAGGLKVADIIVTDDGDGTNTLTLTGADAAAFDIVGFDLIFRGTVTLDYEIKSQYDVTVVLDDTAVGATPDGSVDVTINLSDVNESPISAVIDSDGAANRVNENAAIGSTVRVVAFADDTDGTDSVSYTLVNDASLPFTVNSTTGVVTTDGPLDFESIDRYSITITATSTDGSSTVLNSTIRVLDVNEAGVTPILDIDPTTNRVRENVAIGTTVGVTASANDPDGSDTVSYSLTDDARLPFTIDSATGVITTDGSINFEATDRYDLTVFADSTDGSRTSSTFTVRVRDVNDVQPAVTPGQAFVVAENRRNGHIVGNVLATDQDTVGGFQDWAIVAGDPAGAFSIDPATGSLIVSNAATIDHETNPEYTLRVRVSDGNQFSGVQSVTVTISDVNERPSIGDATFSLVENRANGTPVGVVPHTDPDGGIFGTQTHAITGGNTSGAFQIDPATGRITVSDETQIDFETQTSWSLVVTTTDGGGLTDTASVTINVLNQNEAPILAGPLAGAASDLDPVRRLNLLRGASDPDGDHLTVSGLTVVSGNAVGLTTLGNRLELNPAAYNYLEANGTEVISITFDVSDGSTGLVPQTLQLTISGNNDVPVGAQDSYSTLSGNTLTVTPTIGVLSNDADPDASLIRAVIAEGPKHGNLQLNADGSFDYIPADGFIGMDSFTYQPTDGTAMGTVTEVQIQVNTAVAPLITNTTVPTNQGETPEEQEPVTDDDSSPLLTSLVSFGTGVGPGVTTSESDNDGGTRITPAFIFVQPDREEVEFAVTGIKLPELIRGEVQAARAREASRAESSTERNSLSVIGQQRFRGAEGITYSARLSETLDAIDQEMRASLAQDDYFVSATSLGIGGFSVGYVFWLLRSGSLFASMLTSLPAWRMVDPLPILDILDGAGDEDDESLETVIDKSQESIANRER